MIAVFVDLTRMDTPEWLSLQSLPVLALARLEIEGQSTFHLVTNNIRKDVAGMQV